MDVFHRKVLLQLLKPSAPMPNFAGRGMLDHLALSPSRNCHCNMIELLVGSTTGHYNPMIYSYPVLCMERAVKITKDFINK